MTKAQELRNIVDDWVNKTFNFIHIDVIKKVLESENEELYDHIEPLPVNYDDIMNEYDLHEEYKEWAKENGYELSEIDSKLTKEEFLESEYPEYIESAQEGNYPMWNTVFEQKFQWSKISEVALMHGCGVINMSEYFNDAIFMMSAGHSFYSSYWIPIYLDLFPKEKERFKDVNYEHC